MSCMSLVAPPAVTPREERTMTGLLFASLRRREVREVELFAVLDTLNGTFPEAFRQTQIGDHRSYAAIPPEAA